MIPEIDPIFDVDSEFEQNDESSLTYHMKLDRDRVIGNTDEIEAMKQAIYKIIFTERYEHVIYSWDYGIELKDLFGMPQSYVRAELPRRFNEALLQDERIISLSDFTMKFEKRGNVSVYFIAHTIFGDVKAGRGVRI